MQKSNVYEYGDGDKGKRKEDHLRILYPPKTKRCDKNQTKNPTKELCQIPSVHTTWNRNQTVLRSSGTSIKTSTCKEPSLTKGPIKNKRCIENKCVKRNNTVDTSIPNRVLTKPLPPVSWDENPFPKKIVKATPKSSVAKEASPSPKTFTPPSPNRQINRSSPVAMSSKSPAKKPTDSAPAQSSSRPPSKQNPRAASNVARDDLQACQYCNRRFAEDRLATHEDICAKTGKKKRKVYDATKHRVLGTELEQYTRKPNKSLQQKPQPAPAKKTNWRKKHEEFIGAIRAAKMAQAHVAKGGKLSDLPPPPPSENPDYVQCPHCGRKFNQSAAERHIPKCATYEFNKRKGGGRK